MKTFKGWAIPGPIKSDDEGAAKTSEPLTNLNETSQVTLDSLSGDFKIFQYKEGHRFSTDDLLVAWYGLSNAPQTRNILELGCGIGTISHIALWKTPFSNLVAIEAQERSLVLARESFRFNGLQSDRLQLIHSDLREVSAVTLISKLPGTKAYGFDLIFGSPPYFDLLDGVTAEHPQKVECRFEVRGDIRDYAKCASQVLAPSGVFAFVYPDKEDHHQKRSKEAIDANGLVCLRSRPIEFKEGEGALLRLFLCGKKEHFASPTFTDEEQHSILFDEPKLTIRMKDGRVTDEYRNIKLFLGFRPSR